MKLKLRKRTKDALAAGAVLMVGVIGWRIWKAHKFKQSVIAGANQTVDLGLG